MAGFKLKEIEGVVYATYANGVNVPYIPSQELPQEYRTRLKSGEIIALLKDPALPTKGSYAKIYRAAYPQGNKPEDDIALEFLEQAKNPYSSDGLIDVADIEGALDYFITQNYIDAEDKARVMQGWQV